MKNLLEEHTVLVLPTIFMITIIIIEAMSLYVDANKQTPDISNAVPISQQKIGDDVNQDILIIYEAEVDGETVYPSVVKESK